MTTVGLIGPSDREELARLAMRLEERGARGVFLDSRVDPRIELTPEGDCACGVDLAELRAFYVADLGLPNVLIRRADGGVDAEASQAAGAASRRQLAAWNALLERLSARCRVVNPPGTYNLHALKPWELMGYARATLPTPYTVATSDPAALMQLPPHDDGWIRKGMMGGFGYTEVFEAPASLPAARAALATAAMVQQRIQGDNVRAFVLEGRIIGAAEVLPVEGAEIDSRRGEARVRRIALPQEAMRTAALAARRFGLVFAAVDFMVDARTKHYVLLECNSAPFFVAFEQRSGCDISSPLADHLLSRRVREPDTAAA